MSAADSSLKQSALDVEARIFRRGVSDQEVRQAIRLIREYVVTQLRSNADEIAWWSAFAEVYDDLSRNFTPQQAVALEIATNTVLVSLGCSSWSSMCEALRTSRRTVALDASVS